MKMKLTKRRSGTPETFYNAISEAEKSKQKRIFTYSTLAERYILFTYLFDNSIEVSMFSRDISLFSKQNLMNLINEKCENIKEIRDKFIKSFTNYMNKENVILQILVDNITSDSIKQIDDSIKQTFINAIDKYKIELKEMNDELSKVKGINHFTLTRDRSLVCFEQEERDFDLFSVGDYALHNTSCSVFDGFFTMSKTFQREEITNNK